ncbi:hypothetical protein PCE1_001468 [Barthelona sp. PCE]
MVFIVRAQYTKLGSDLPVEAVVDLSHTDKGFLSIHIESDFGHKEEVFQTQEFFPYLNTRISQCDSPNIGILNFLTSEKEKNQLTQLSVSHSHSDLEKNENLNTLSDEETADIQPEFTLVNNFYSDTHDMMEPYRATNAKGNERMNDLFQANWNVNNHSNGVMVARRPCAPRLNPKDEIHLDDMNPLDNQNKRTLQHSVSDLNTAALNDTRHEIIYPQLTYVPSSEESISAANICSLVIEAAQTTETPYFEMELDTPHGAPEQVSNMIPTHDPINFEDDDMLSDGENDGVIVNSLDSHRSYSHFDVEQQHNNNTVLSAQPSVNRIVIREATNDEPLLKFQKLQQRFKNQLKFFRRCGVSQEYLYALSGINALLDDFDRFHEFQVESMNSDLTEINITIRNREINDMCLTLDNVDITGVPRDI